MFMSAPKPRPKKSSAGRTVVVQMGITLDGFVHGAEGYEDWGLPAEEDDVVAWKAESLRQAGTHIMGRKTYEDMAQVWPNSTGIYADIMNEIPKVVFSSSLATATWPESRIAAGDLTEEITALKEASDDGVILAHGGATFLDSLIREHLVDEYRLVIHPVVIGNGRSLFGALREPLRLEIVEARTFPSGTTVEVCRPLDGDR